MSAEAKPAATFTPVDPVEDLAKQIFIHMSAQVFATPSGDQAKPQPKTLVMMSFKLAEAFIEGNFEFNTAAKAAREAKAKSSVDVSKIEIDFGAIGKT